MHNWLEIELEQIKEKGLYRELKTAESIPASSVVINGIEYLMAASNNYLGLAGDRRLIRAAIIAHEKFGIGSSGSRLTTGNTILHDQLEQRIASFKNKEAAMLFSSGYLANIGVISSLAGEEDCILSDELNHASIIDGCRLSKAKTIVYKHVDMEDLEKKLKEAQGYRYRFIVTDGVFSMDGNIAPLPDIVKLAKQYDAYVIVDDAHATGVLGENGRGTSEFLNVDVDVTIGTLSKAVGTEGGFVVGSQKLIDYLRNKARSFIFQTGMSPGIAAASKKAIDIIEEEPDRREHLHRLERKLREKLVNSGFCILGEQTPIIPVVIGEADKAVQFAQKLLEAGIYAPAIRPPTVPEGMSRIRLTLMASHTEEEISYIHQSIERIGKELKMMKG